MITRFYLPFLGARNYLHGTTLFDALAPVAPADAGLVFKFSKMIRSNVVEITDDSENADASLTWRHAGGSESLFVRSTHDPVEIERRPYQEQLIADAVQFRDGVATIDGESPFSFVATLIPVHKALLAHHGVAATFPPGQWVFTRLELNRRPATFRTIEMRLASVLGTQLVRSEVMVEGTALGTIFFSWLPK